MLPVSRWQHFANSHMKEAFPGINICLAVTKDAPRELLKTSVDQHSGVQGEVVGLVSIQTQQGDTLKSKLTKRHHMNPLILWAYQMAWIGQRSCCERSIFASIVSSAQVEKFQLKHKICIVAQANQLISPCTGHLSSSSAGNGSHSGTVPGVDGAI